MHTHRISLFSDTAVTCWVRDEDGKRDLSGFTLSAIVYPYGKTTELLTVDADSDADGEAVFTVTAANAEAYLWPGVFRFVLKGVDGGDPETLYSGLLEAV